MDDDLKQPDPRPTLPTTTTVVPGLPTPRLPDVHPPNPFDAPAVDAADVVSVCAWCPELNILKLQRRASDVVIVYQMGSELRIMRNGTNLAISHGMCPSCKVAMLKSVEKEPCGTCGHGRAEHWHNRGPEPFERIEGTICHKVIGLAVCRCQEWVASTVVNGPESGDVLAILQSGVTLVENFATYAFDGGGGGGLHRSDTEAWLRDAKAVLG